MFLGENLLAWLVLALGGALFVGNLLAVIKPPEVARAETDMLRVQRRSLPRCCSES